MTLKALREKRAQLVADMRGVLNAAESENRDLNDDERKDYAAKETELNVLNERISRMENLEANEEHLEAARPAAAARSTRPVRGPEASREFESIGEFLHAVRFNPNDQRLEFVEHDVHGEQRMDDGASGGFMVPTQFRSELLRVDPSMQIMRPAATVIPAGSPPDSSITMPALDQSSATNMYGGVQVSWIGEGATKPDTSAKLREITLTPQEVAASTVITDKLLRNWQAAGALLSSLLRGAISAAEDTAFLQGDGVAKPLGVLASSALGTINRGTANKISYDDLVSMSEILFLNGSQAFWVTTQRGVGQLMRLEDTEGHLIWQPSAREGEPATLLGRPVRVSDRIPTLGSKGDIMLIAGSNYLIKDGSGPFVASSEHVLFQQNKTMIKAFWNVDGQPWLKGPIKRENGELQYPFVALDVPA